MNKADNTVSLKVQIANRTLPLRVKPEEESIVHEASELVNRKLQHFGELYPARDPQDLLAMCILQFASENLEYHKKEKVTEDILARGLAEIHQLLDNQG